jgi:CRP/FNR family transcriptional regulator
MNNNAAMPSLKITAQLRALYPSVDDMPVGQLDHDVTNEASLLHAGHGDILFQEGQPCDGFPLLLEGEICVSHSSSTIGRSMELYRVIPGEICVVSTSSLLANRVLNAQGTAVAQTVLILLPPTMFERWTTHAPFRRFVFGVFSERLVDLMTLIDAIAFQRLDRRLAHHLLGHGQILRTTHQALADDLGTVREIVTRLLNRFQAAGYVRLARERIEVLDAAGLRAVATGHAPSF